MEERYYKVIIACGHIGHGGSLEVTRYFKAFNTLDCYTSAFHMPRAKKKCDSIKLIEQISLEQYTMGKQTEDENPYLKIHKSPKRANKVA